MKRVLFIGVFATIAVLGIYYGLTWYDDILKWGRMIDTPAVRPHEQPLLISEKGTVPFNRGEALTKARIKDKSLPIWNLSNDSLVDLGRKEYQVFCSHCHGENLDGEGTVGQSFNPLPTDLTSPKVAGKSDGVLFLHISNGGNRSPALATSMSEESRWAVISFLRAKQAERQ